MSLPPIDLPLERKPLTEDKLTFWAYQLQPISKRWRVAILRKLAERYGPEAAKRIEEAARP